MDKPPSLNTILALLEDERDPLNPDELKWDPPPSRGAIQNIVRAWEDLPEQMRIKELPFQWHRLEMAGLPWESSEWLLKCLASYQVSRLAGAFEAKYALGDTYVHDFLDWCEPFTNRWAVWCWRVHLAEPDSELLELSKVFAIARLYSDAELASDLRGKEVLREVPTLDLRGLDDFLSLKPYRGTYPLVAYREACSLGIAHPLPSWDSIGELESALTGIPSLNEQHAWYSLPWVLGLYRWLAALTDQAHIEALKDDVEELQKEVE